MEIFYIINIVKYKSTNIDQQKNPNINEYIYQCRETKMML